MKKQIFQPDTGEKEQDRLRSYLSFFTLALLVFIIDQAGKYWVIRQFNPGETRPLIKGVLYLTYVRNPGAAFGLFAHKTPFFIAISFALIVLMVLAAFTIPARLMLLRCGLALSLGGVLGNLYDRLQTGSVVDFLDLRFWPVFNIADVALVMGVFLVALGLLRLSAPDNPVQGGG